MMGQTLQWWSGVAMIALMVIASEIVMYFVKQGWRRWRKDRFDSSLFFWSGAIALIVTPVLIWGSSVVFIQLIKGFQ